MARHAGTNARTRETGIAARFAAIETGRVTRPRRTLVYGTHGIGKSSFAARFPSAIVVQTEEGLNGIEVARFPLAKSFDDVIDALGSLAEHEHAYRTVVIDSLDWLERLVWAATVERHGKQGIEEFGYGKGYVFALDLWKVVLDTLDVLREERGMAVVLIAHAAVERFNNPETDPYDRFVPRLQRLASAFVQEWCDEVLFATYRVNTRTVSDGGDRVRRQGVGDGTRVLFTQERPGHVAKNRLGLDSEMPLDFDLYAAAVAASLSTPSSKEARHATT
jgi:hypothetical protein